jgi:putative ABC transport system permease protein
MIGSHLRHTLRSFLRAPSHAAVAVLTIALGVGAGTTLFSVVKAVLLNPLPYPEPDRLAWIAAVTAGAQTRTSMPDFDDCGSVLTAATPGFSAGASRCWVFRRP